MKGEQTKLNWNNKEDESLEEIKSRTIIHKIKEKQLLSKQLHMLPNEIEMEDVTHYTVEAQKIAIKWKKVRKD